MPRMGAINLENPQVLLCREESKRRRSKGRGNDDLGEDIDQGFGHGEGDLAIGGDNATERGDWVGFMGKAIGSCDIRTHRDPARIRMLDDGYCRFQMVERCSASSSSRPST